MGSYPQLTAYLVRSQFHMWSDNETSTDLLGFAVHKDLIRHVITDQALMPVTVGVFGDWGGGKSSILRMLEQDLLREEDIACLLFNGWTFEGYDDAKSALISSILIQLGEHKRFGPKVRDKVVSLLKRVNYMRVASMILRNASYATSAATGLGVATGFVDPHLGATLVGAASGIGGVIHDAAEKSGVEVPSINAQTEVDWASLINKDP